MALMYWHWEAMLVSYLSTRKTVLPFTSIAEMYEKTSFRLALRPQTTYHNNFRYTTDALFRKVYHDRVKPYVMEYSQLSTLKDFTELITNESDIAFYNSYIPIR